MIETIDDITTDDLFCAISDATFVNKLHIALNNRIKHYSKWAECSDGDLKEKFYAKTKAFIQLKRDLHKFCKTMDF